MIIKKKTEAGEIVIDTNKITMSLNAIETKAKVEIRKLITPTYGKYEEVDLCSVNEVESEVFLLVKLLLSTTSYFDIKLVEGNGSYIGAIVIVHLAK